MDTKALIDGYYQGLHTGGGWEDLLAPDFRFIGGDMTKPEPVVGREAYVAIIGRFSRLFTAVRVDRLFVSGNQAAVLATYDYSFPSGTRLPGSVAEFWTIDNGQLKELTIFFDSQSFAKLTQP
jgi:ketosteroid isomerase-like protein